jgi:hypothetical protein
MSKSQPQTEICPILHRSWVFDPMDGSEAIIELGAEGGSVTLYGSRAKRGWIFIREVVDWTPELIDQERIQHQSDTVDSWEAVLDLLDQYHWHKLSPILVHPDFRQPIWVAVQQRLHSSKSDLNRWRDFYRHTESSEGS